MMDDEASTEDSSKNGLLADLCGGVGIMVPAANSNPRGGVPLLMRCLSVRQPWAWAICSGEKRVENRTWSTNFRGTIAIHAGSSKVGINELRRQANLGKLDESNFPLGAVVGVADVVDCVPLSEQLEDDPWAQGPICWILANARRLHSPIPMKGKLNLFSLPTDVAEQVERQLNTPCRKEVLVDAQLLTYLLDPLEERWFIQMSAYAELNKMDQVLRLANRYVSRFPDLGIGYRFRAFANHQLGDGGAALEDANRAIDLDSQDAGAHYVRAMVQFDHGYFETARSNWARSRELGADLPPFESLQFDDEAGSLES